MEKLLIEEKEKLLYQLFGIPASTQKIEIQFDDLPAPDENGKIQGIVLENINGFKFISSIKEVDIQSILLSTKQHVEKQCKMQINIISLNNFDCTIACQIHMKIDDSVSAWEIMESTNSSLIGKIYGIKLGTEYQLWIEYLLMSYILFELNNEKMAFLVAFAALDQFIENLYTRLPLIYQNVYFENIDILTEQDADFLEKKRDKYSNLNRRLVEEKLHDILTERFDDPTIYSVPYSAIISYEKIRNKIAHCEVTDCRGKYLNLLLNILKILYLAGLGVDITQIFKEK